MARVLATKTVTLALANFDKEMNVRDLTGDGLIIGMSGALLWHISNIWVYGEHLIREPNALVLSLETIGFLVILAFGITKFVGDLKGKRR